MSLLGRPKAKTHKGMAMDKLMRLTGEIEEIAEDGVVRADAIDELSADLGVPREKLYAGLGMSGTVNLELEHEVQFVICTGGCQDYGALPCVSELLDIRDERLESSEAAFDVVPRHCLNRCQNAPVIEIRTADGTAVLVDATPEQVQTAVEEIFGD